MQKKLHLILLVIYTMTVQLMAQAEQDAFRITGTIVDEYFKPVGLTHVFATGSGQGDVTDPAGNFEVLIRAEDRLSIFNIGYRDTVVQVSKDQEYVLIRVESRYHGINEVKVFRWGATYEDFLSEMERLGPGQSVGQKLELPQQDPDYVPFDMDEKKLKSPGFLLSSPVSFFYYNFSKREKAARKAYVLDKNADKIELFKNLTSAENIASITGLEGEELQKFILYLNTRMHSTYASSEFDILSEIHSVWDRYSKDKRTLDE